MSLVVGAVILWIVPIFVAHSIGKAKMRAGIGYGVFLGWLGVLVLAVLPPGEPITLENIERHRTWRLGDREYRETKARLEREAKRYRECPHCREQMRFDASVCPHCQRDIEPARAAS